MGNTLDLLVDGEIITEALILERTPEGEQLIYSGKGFLKSLHENLIILIKYFEHLEYCVLCYPSKKYLAVRLTPRKYLILAMSKEAPAEKYLKMVVDFFEKLYSASKQHNTEGGVVST